MPRDESADNHVLAHQVVNGWMNTYKRYLLDGDPNVVHPKAKAALVLAIAAALDDLSQASIPKREAVRAKR